jgi:Ca-activated chloride channel family protein
MMMKSPRKSLLWATLAVLLAARVGVAQNPPPAGPPPASNPAASPTTPPAGEQKPATPPSPQNKISTTTAVVVVPVTVKDKNGNMIAGLRRDDFRVFEDKIEQKITELSADPRPLSLVVLVDNDMKQKDADQVDASLPAILAGMSLSDEADVCRFDQFFYPGKGFTKDQDNLLKQLKRTKLDSQPSVASPGGPFNGPSINNAPAPGAGNQDPSLIAIKGQSTKALDDAVYEAAQLLKDMPTTRRKIILLISDGKNGAKFNNHKYDEVRNELLRYNIIVYSVATGSSYFDRKFTRLVEYSGETGGDVSYGAKAESFENFYAQIADQARNQYTLSYSPKGSPGLSYHTIEVRVEREGLNVTARKGYYGGVPQ